MSEEDGYKKIIIPNDGWKTFDENPPSEKPCWLKLANGNIVLAVYKHNGYGATGWWAVSEKNGKFFGSMNEGYIVRDAMWQKCDFLC